MASVFSSNKSIIDSVVDKLEEAKLKPLHYIRKSASRNSNLQSLIAEVNKLVLSRSGYSKNEILQEIFIQNFESEQIWQQIELKNKFLKSYIPRITKLLLSKEVNFPFTKENESGASYLAGDGSGRSKSSVVNVENDSNIENEDDEFVADNTVDINEGNVSDDSSSNFQNDSYSVDRNSFTADMFFNLNEMESFLDKADKENEGEEDGIDYYFTDMSGEEDDILQPMYKDFFEDPQPKKRSIDKNEVSDEIDSNGLENNDNDLGEGTKSNKRHSVKNIDDKDELQIKKVRFLSEEETSVEEFEIPYMNEQSSFEKRNFKLKEQIAKMEESALSEKPWPQRGEVDGQQRPHNSLLEEIVDIDVTSRPAPVITELVTTDLETIIIRRIKDKVYDDVKRKIKPVHVQHELKKEVVLDQEKSKFSLAQIYEQEYLSKQEVNNDPGISENKEVTEEKEEILKMMKSVFQKLDTLSNFHYTPKPVIEELKIISNTPAITLEESLPTAVSDGNTLAPQEITGSKKKVLIGKDEQSKADKLRKRRRNKAFLAKKLKKPKNIAGPTTKILKSKKASLVAGKEKAVKTSTTFFTKLQENAEVNFISKKHKQSNVKYKPHK